MRRSASKFPRASALACKFRQPRRTTRNGAAAAALPRRRKRLVGSNHSPRCHACKPANSQSQNWSSPPSNRHSSIRCLLTSKRNCSATNVPLLKCWESRGRPRNQTSPQPLPLLHWRLLRLPQVQVMVVPAQRHQWQNRLSLSRRQALRMRRRQLRRPLHQLRQSHRRSHSARRRDRARLQCHLLCHLRNLCRQQLRVRKRTLQPPTLLQRQSLLCPLRMPTLLMLLLPRSIPASQKLLQRQCPSPRLQHHQRLLLRLRRCLMRSPPQFRQLPPQQLKQLHPTPLQHLIAPRHPAQAGALPDLVGHRPLQQ